MLCLAAEIATRNSALKPSSPDPLRKHCGRGATRSTSPQQPRQRLSLLRESPWVRLLQLALYTCGAIVTACATVIGFVVPFTLHPLAMPCVPLVVSLLLSRAVGSFHLRGA